MKFLKLLLRNPLVKNIAFMVLAAFAIVFIVLKWLNMTTNHGEFREVPDLQGKSIDVVKALLEEQDLNLKVQDCTNFNPDFPKYSVLEQNPVAGTKVKENRKIYVNLNPSGYKKIKVPNIVGKTKRQAIFTLKALEFKIGKVTTRREFAKDVVLEMRYKGKKLEPGTMLSKTMTIDLVVSDGSLDFGQKAPAEGEGGTTIEGQKNAGDDGAATGQ